MRPDTFQYNIARKRFGTLLRNTPGMIEHMFRFQSYIPSCIPSCIRFGTLLDILFHNQFDMSFRLLFDSPIGKNFHRHQNTLDRLSRMQLRIEFRMMFGIRFVRLLCILFDIPSGIRFDIHLFDSLNLYMTFGIDFCKLFLRRASDSTSCILIRMWLRMSTSMLFDLMSHRHNRTRFALSKYNTVRMWKNIQFLRTARTKMRIQPIVEALNRS